MEVHVPQGEGAVSGMVFGVLRNFRPIGYFTMATYGYTDIGLLIDNRLVCEKLAVFPYARYTVEFCVEFPFLQYSQIQDRSGD